MPKISRFWRVFENSVTRQVSFNKTKFVENAKIQMRHFDSFLNNVRDVFWTGDQVLKCANIYIECNKIGVKNCSVISLLLVRVLVAASPRSPQENVLGLIGRQNRKTANLFQSAASLFSISITDSSAIYCLCRCHTFPEKELHGSVEQRSLSSLLFSVTFSHLV